MWHGFSALRQRPHSSSSGMSQGLIVCLKASLQQQMWKCGNVYPYTVTDDRVGRDKKRKDNGREFSPRNCIRKFSYHEIFCTIYVQRRFLNKHLRHSHHVSHALFIRLQFRRAMRRVFAILGHFLFDWKSVHVFSALRQRPRRSSGMSVCVLRQRPLSDHERRKMVLSSTILVKLVLFNLVTNLKFVGILICQ